MAINDFLGKAPSVSGVLTGLIADAKNKQSDTVALDGKSAEETIRQTAIVRRQGGLGELSSAVTLAYHGLNHRGYGNPIQNNTDNYGLVFFTRPRLNLSYDNIMRDRIFTVLASNKEISVQKAIRAWLDPVGSKKGAKGSFNTPLVDDLNPFITLLTNNINTLTGWPDPYVETFTSTEGVYKEQWGMIDGPSRFYGQFSLNATFRNIVDDPISQLFNIWTQYASRVYEGAFMPFLDSIFENEIDYNTRIYRLVLDHSRTYVQKIGACGASFPVANNLGASFNYDGSKPYSDEIDSISVGFQCFGAIYNDPILVDAFNRTAYMFNPAMIPRERAKFYQKLKPEERLAFNYIGYPQINPETMELEWWVSFEDYERIMGSMSDGTTKPTSVLIEALNGGALPNVETIIRQQPT